MHQFLFQQLGFGDVFQQHHLIVNPGGNGAFNIGFVQADPVWAAIQFYFAAIEMGLVTLAEVDQQAAPGFGNVFQV